MQFNQIIMGKKEKTAPILQHDRQTFARAIKRAGILSLIVMAGLGALASATLTKPYDASCEIVVELYKKGDGGWEKIDQAKSMLNGRLRILDFVSSNMANKVVESNHTWRARSEQGRQITVNLAGRAKGRLDMTSGKADMDLPCEVNVDGQRILIGLKMTNQSLTTPVGERSGKKTEINGPMMSGGMVCFNEIRQSNLIDHLLNATGNEVARGKENKGSRSMKSPARAPLLVVITMNGRAIEAK